MDLWRAVESNETAKVQKMLDDGFNVNEPNAEGELLIVAMARDGNIDAVKLLVEHNSVKPVEYNAHNSTREQETALIEASREGHDDIVKYLCMYKADVNKASKSWTPLGIAASEGHLQCVKNLVAHGAEVNMQFKSGMTALMEACNEGHADIVEYLCENAADIHLQNKDGWTAIFHAAGKGHSQCLQYLLEHGASVNIQSHVGWTAAHLAAIYGDIPCLQTLLQHEADVTLTTNCGDTVLQLATKANHKECVYLLKSNMDIWTAAKTGNIQRLKQLIEEGHDVNKPDSKGYPPLLWAAWDGLLSIVQLLVANGANVNAQGGKDKMSALMCACTTGQAEIIQYLLSKNANVNLRDDVGDEALMYAVDKGHLNCIRLLLENGADINLQSSKRRANPLMYAAENGSEDVLSCLLKYGAKVDLKCSEGRSALWYATYPGHLQCVKLLINYGLQVNFDLTCANSELSVALKHDHIDIFKYLMARGSDQQQSEVLIQAVKMRNCPYIEKILKCGINANVKDSHGNLALVTAAENNSGKCMKLLLQYGTNTGNKDMLGSDALSVTAARGHLRCMRLLLDHGANANLHNGKGTTPLITAIQQRQTKCVNILLNHKTDPNLTDCIGETPLSYAIQGGDKSVVQMLVTRGSDVNMPAGPTKITPLMVASSKGHIEITRYLCSKGAVIQVEDSNGSTAFDYAGEEGHEECVEYLKKVMHQKLEEIESMMPLPNLYPELYQEQFAENLEQMEGIHDGLDPVSSQIITESQHQYFAWNSSDDDSLEGSESTGSVSPSRDETQHFPSLPCKRVLNDKAEDSRKQDSKRSKLLIDDTSSQKPSSKGTSENNDIIFLSHRKSTGESGHQKDNTNNLCIEKLSIGDLPRLSSGNPNSLREIAKGKMSSRMVATRNTQIQTRNLFDREQFRTSLRKGYREYIGTSVNGEGDILRASNSDVRLTIPKGAYCTIIGYIHTHTLELLKEIPAGEYLIAPMPEYSCEIKHMENTGTLFEIKIPHCVKNENLLQNIKVRCGDIHKGKQFRVLSRKTPFTPVGQPCYEVDKDWITIYTPHFCQFICTCCSEECKGDVQALLFGSHIMIDKVTLVHMSKLYLCGPLYSITDYKSELCNKELMVSNPRYLIDQMRVKWLTKVSMRQLKNWKMRMSIKVNTRCWKPKQPQRPELEWDQDGGTLTEMGDLEDLLSFGHHCNKEPAAVAQFTFQYAKKGKRNADACRQFTGTLQLTVTGGKNQQVTSSMEIYQPRMTVDHQKETVMVKKEKPNENDTKMTEDIKKAELCSLASQVSSIAFTQIAITFLDYSMADTDTLKAKHREDQWSYNYEILDNWKNRTDNSQRKELSRVLYEASDLGIVDSAVVEDVLKLPRKQVFADGNNNIRDSSEA